MPESVANNPSTMPRAVHGKGKISTKGGYTYRFLLAALFITLVGAILLVEVKDNLKQYTKDLTLREILVWLNPGFSEVPEELLPFGNAPKPERTTAPDAQLSGSLGDNDPFMDKDNLFCQTAGHAASTAKESSTSRIPISGESPPALTKPEKSALILPETPRGVETAIQPIVQAAKSLEEAETRGSQGTNAAANKENSQQPSTQHPQKTKTPDPPASKEVANSEKQVLTSPKKDTPDWEANPRSEKFQLPGSVLVKIQNYAGTSVHWDLAVIFDNSHSMGRQTKSWNPSRFQAAITFIQKLPSALDPGSKMAVRDFQCGSNKDKKDAKKGCSSRLLIDWTSASSKQWKDLLEKTDHSGSTDPCAAAALSVKRDFHGRTGRKPRLLVITGGAAVPCASSLVVKAIEGSDTTKGLAVDVLALGLGKKRQKSFSALAQKTGGIFLEIDRPADVDHAFTRYARVLHAKVFEKVEIKNEKASLSFNPHQEISLAPGTYTVILPLVEGLESSKRVIPNVKISSAETSIIDVTIRKGRPIVRIEKKQ